MNKISQLNQSLLLLLIFTIISSSIAFYLVAKGYEHAFAISSLEIVE